MPDRSWHFEKRLSVDTVVSILGVALVIGGPVFYWGRGMENRVQALEVVQIERSRADNQRSSDEREQRLAITSRLDKIEEKVTQMQITVGQLVPFAAGGKK